MPTAGQSTTQSQSVEAPRTENVNKTEAVTKSQGSKRPSRLMTFKAPTPSWRQIKLLVPVNRWLFLGGIPGLRSLPGIGRIPGIRGLTNIPKLDFPKADEQRLKQATASTNACFIVPNHPEFFTDWMLDKEIMTRVAPRAASWATHDVVNGMGKGPQKFWLKNNLIAQIPGAGGAEGKAYSIEWALKGNSVLLHPEGAVGWHGDLIGRIYPGAVDMAVEAAKRADGNRRVLVAPVIWKLKFNKDVEPGLHKELDYVEKSLELPVTSHSIGLAQRLYNAYDALLARDETKYGIHPTSAPFFERQDTLIAKLLVMLGDALDERGAEPARHDSTDEQIRRGERWLRSVDRKSELAKPVQKLVRNLRLLGRFGANIYTDELLTQEHIAESIKRIRNDYCAGTTRDTVNNFLPQPAGPRTAHIRIPEPLDVSALMATTSVPAMIDDLRARMQIALDEINRELAAKGNVITYPNVFL